jgi:DNA-binding beta-propeller fold protein YncE
MRSLPAVVRAILLGAAFCLALACSRSGTGGRKVAPGFAGATAWLNVDHAITMDELKGKVVVVDFWTSCCINCIHTLPVLSAIEHRFAGRPVVVLGVHSAKFDAERDADRLRDIVSEYSIVHPIAVDGSMKIWDAWGARAWPTVKVLDSTGHIVWTGSGEPKESDIAAAVDEALAKGAQAGALSEKPLAGLRHEVDHSGPLSFPGKVIVLADGTLAISDSGHHRVVFAGADGAVLSVVGSGLAGMTDGGFEEASFKKPQGLTEVGDLVYVADTENHAIRAIDRSARKVSTVAGTGEIGAGHLVGTSPARTTKLRSPWDLVAASGVVYVALAGSHQIGAFHPREGTIEAFAGDGTEQRLDGAGMAASFAQPSGLATDGTRLFVADSETSSVREVSIATRDVHTIVGQDLFVFGDVDGPAPRVRLEHPLGVAFGAGAVWVADTYNSKVKRIDLATDTVATIVGGRDHAALYEPEGLFFHADELVVADTKHHRVAIVPVNGAQPATPRAIELRGLTAPPVGVALEVATAAPPPGEAIDLGEVALPAGGPTRLRFEWKVPDGTGVNDDAPFHVTWTSSDGLATVPTALRSKGATVQRGFDLEVTPIAGATGGRLGGELGLVLCDTKTHLVCVPVRRAIGVSFRLATDKAPPPPVMIPLPAAKI